MSVEAFIFLVVAQGQILSSGALAVKIGFAAVMLLMIQTILSRRMVDEVLRPLLDRKPAMLFGLFLLAVLVFYLSKLLTDHISELLLSVNRNHSNIETYLSNSWQRTVSLIFPLFLIMVIYFRLFQRNTRFTPLTLTYYINEPHLLITFVYGLTWQVIASTFRWSFFPSIIISTLAFGLMYFFAAIILAKRSAKSPGLRMAIFHMPGVIIEATGGSSFSILGELSHYPYGLGSLIISMITGMIAGNIYRKQL